MIENLLLRTNSCRNVVAARDAFEGLPGEFGLLLDLHYEGKLSVAEIARLLKWSETMVRERLKRACSLVNYRLHPERFELAYAILAGRWYGGQCAQERRTGS